MPNNSEQEKDRMAQRKNHHKFVCFRNGAPLSAPFDEAYRGVWAANLRWVVPIAWYMWELGRHEDQFYLRDRRILKAEEDFALKLHSRRCCPVTVEHVFAPEGPKRKNPRNALAARASRFGNEAFGNLGDDYDELLPFESVDIPTSCGTRRYGYQMKRGVGSFVVVELDCVPENRELDFDWSLFLEPPACGKRGGRVA